MHEKVKGRIEKNGMGGFLNPPTHPEHSYRVQGKGFCMSITVAVQDSMLEECVRARARMLLENWVKPPLKHPEIQDWIYQVLGYFRNCYSKDGAGRNLCKDMVVSEQPLDENRHLGVMHIRNWYPSYVPTKLDFKNAYWGRKKDRSA